MRLVDLDPRWVDNGGDDVTDGADKPVPLRKGVALAFNCPCGCKDDVAIHITNPLDGGPKLMHDGFPTWERTGEDFESLTLRPSILRMGGCGWHGFITNGEIQTC